MLLLFGLIWQVASGAPAGEGMRPIWSLMNSNVSNFRQVLRSGTAAISPETFFPFGAPPAAPLCSFSGIPPLEALASS